MLTFKSVNLGNRIIDVDLHLEKAQWWALLGPNGAGKSSLLSVAAALETRSAGSMVFSGVDFDDVSLATFAARRCLVTQSYRTEFSISVKEMLSFFTQLDEVPALIEQHLTIMDLVNAPFDTLSGGEKQRVHLARNFMQIWPAIESGEALVLLDEPLQQMDVKHQMCTLKLISALQSLGNTIVMSHHDINQTMQYCSHVCLIKSGKVTHDGPRDQVINVERLASLYSQGFKVLYENEANGLYFVPE